MMNALSVVKKLKREVVDTIPAALSVFKSSNTIIEKVFNVLGENEKIAFCADIIRLWEDKERAEEAKALFEDIIDKDVFEKYSGRFLWGMTLTTRYTFPVENAIQQLRVWIDRPANIQGDFVDSCGGAVLLSLNGDLKILDKYWSALKKSLRPVTRKAPDSQLSNGVRLCTHWIH